MMAVADEDNHLDRVLGRQPDVLSNASWEGLRKTVREDVVEAAYRGEREAVELAERLP